MQIIWQIDPQDIAKVRAFYQQHESNPAVQDRACRNLADNEFLHNLTPRSDKMSYKRKRTVVINLVCLAAVIGIGSLLAFFGHAVTLAAGGIHTVCTAGPPTCDYDNVQDAVDAADDGDTIKIAAGTYTGVTARAGLSQVVYLTKSLTLQGGYTTAYTEPPDPVNNPTILDAAGAVRVVYILDANGATIAGLHLTGGYNDNAGSNGAGLVADNSTITIRDNWIYSNTATSDWGGGISIDGGSFSLISNTIANNRASNFGAGILLIEGNGQVTSNTIQNNIVGGGVASLSGVVTFTDNLIEGNTRGLDGGGLVVDSGSVLISNNVISGNTSGFYGGGLAVDSQDATVTGNLIVGNKAESCGGFNLFRSSTLFANNIVVDNEALNDSGGGGCVGRNDVANPYLLTGNYIAGNTAANLGGGVYGTGEVLTILDGNTIVENSAMNGGGVAIFDSLAHFTNNIVADNQAGNGSGIYLWGGDHTLVNNTVARNVGSNGIYLSSFSGIGATAGLTNIVVVAHSTGIVASNSMASLEGTLWGSGIWSNTTDWSVIGTGQVILGTINIEADPEFVDPSGQDFHLGPNSAAIDAGVATTVNWDIDDEPRPMGDGFDIGADEVQSSYAVHLPIVLKD